MVVVSPTPSGELVVVVSPTPSGELVVVDDESVMTTIGDAVVVVIGDELDVSAYPSKTPGVL